MIAEALAAALAEEGKSGGWAMGRVERILQEVESEHGFEDAEVLEAILRDGTRTKEAIARIFTKIGYPCSSGAVQTWRKRHNVTAL